MNQHTALATLHLIDIDQIPYDDIAHLLSALSASEIERYHRFQLPLRQRQFVLGRILLRWALAQLLNLPFTHIELVEQDGRAPRLSSPELNPTPGFSISHSGSWVACASSAVAQLGLDIEVRNAARNLVSIAKHSFRPQDVTWMEQQTDQVAAFYELWSSKEARYKLNQGYGISDVEHRYVLPHSYLSLVMLTDQPLASRPRCETVDWLALRGQIF